MLFSCDVLCCRVFPLIIQVPDCLKSKSLEGVELEADERSQSSKQADRGPLERMFPATYGTRLLQVRCGRAKEGRNVRGFKEWRGGRGDSLGFRVSCGGVLTGVFLYLNFSP